MLCTHKCRWPRRHLSATRGQQCVYVATAWLQVEGAAGESNHCAGLRMIIKHQRGQQSSAPPWQRRAYQCSAPSLVVVTRRAEEGPGQCSTGRVDSRTVAVL